MKRVNKICITSVQHLQNLHGGPLNAIMESEFETGEYRKLMNSLKALFCAGLILITPIETRAEDYRTAAGKVPSTQNISVDRQKLKEARQLLVEIRKELGTDTYEQNVTDERSTTSLYALVPTAQQVDEIEALKNETAPTPEPANEAQAFEQKYKSLDDLLVSREGDMEMQCGDLSREAGEMRNIIFTTQDMKDSARMKRHGVTAVAGIGSFLIGTVTGGVGLALGSFLLEQNFGSDASSADKIQDIAEQRRTLMMGIYNARGCNGPLEHAMQNPEIFNPLSRIALAPEYADEEPLYNH